MEEEQIENPILLVDDDEALLRSAVTGLRYRNIRNVHTCADPLLVMDLLREKPFDLVFLDMWMPGMDGESLLAAIREEFPSITVIMVTANNDVDSAVRCIKLGAMNYLIKPVEPTQMVAYIRQALTLQTLQKENLNLRARVPENRDKLSKHFAPIITEDDSMFLLFQYIEAVAPTDHTVLITGESGVGKEMVARSIHDVSEAKGAFVAVNVAGLDDSTLYSALFGHLKGAFTGAERDRAGYIEKAKGGTLFLDEIGDLSLDSQIKLLRLLQEREYYPLGSDTLRRVECRFLVATHRDLADPEHFRKDLFYRLRTHNIRIPPLRERKGDIPRLTESFVKEYCEKQNVNPPRIPVELYPLLATYSFPGNVRELRNIILDTLVQVRGGNLSLEPVRSYLRERTEEVARFKGDVQPGQVTFDLSEVDPLPDLKQIQEMLIAEALRRSEGNQSLAAQMLGVTRQALNKRVRKMDSES